MRLLFVAPRLPYPPWRGDQARAYHQLRLLGTRHEITLLTQGARADREALAFLERHCRELHLVPAGGLSRLAGTWRAARIGQPLQTGFYASPPLRAALARLLRERRHDLLHVQLARGAAALPAEPGLPVVVDLIDSLALNLRRRHATERGPWGWFWRLEAARLARFERQLAGRAQQLTVVSAADRAAIGEFPNLCLNPNGVDLERLQPGRAARAPLQAVFCGNLGYFPNVDAVRRLARAIWPRVRLSLPAARLLLVGARPARAVRRAAQASAGIELAAEVPEVAPYLAASSVAVAPLRAGSGQLFKVLEALACETPLVATSLALAGSDLRAGSEVLVAESDDELAAALVSVLRDPTLGARLGRAGREWVVRRHSWERVVAELETIYARARAAWMGESSTSA